MLSYWATVGAPHANYDGAVVRCEPNLNYPAGVMYVVADRISTGIKSYNNLRDFEPDEVTPITPNTYDGVQADYKNYDDIITGNGHVTSVTRINADGTVSNIRGMAYIDVDNNFLYAIDPEAPLDQTFQYRVQMSNGVDITGKPCEAPWSVSQPSSPRCVPVLLSDPFVPANMQWLDLLNIDALGYAPRRDVIDVLGRGAPVAISSTRQEAETTMTFMTRTLAERTNLLSILSPGRVLLLRNPNPDYPENNWYISIGNVSEERIVPDHANPLRRWTVEVTRVDRPGGILELIDDTLHSGTIQSAYKTSDPVETVLRVPNRLAYGTGRYPTVKSAQSSWGLR